MSDREILLRWLGVVATRLDWSRRIPELGRLACTLLALVLLAEACKALGLPPEVLTALAPLFVFGVLLVIGVFAWRIFRRPTLAQVAGAVDLRAGLKDELKSAYWFSHQPARDPFVELQLARAATTARSLDARRLIPIGVPRSARAALVLAIATAVLAWLSPRFAVPLAQESRAASPVSANAAKALDDVVVDTEFERILAQLASPETTTARDRPATWAQVEQIARQLPHGAEREAIQRAVAARDARLVAQLLRALQHKQASAAELEPNARGEDMPLTAQGDGRERPEEALPKTRKSAAEELLAAAFAQPTARVTQELRGQAEEERRKITGAPAEGNPEFNPRMRAVARTGAAMREIAYAAGEAAEAGPQTSVDGQAKGPPDGKSRSGGNSGEHPESELTDLPDAQPVLGERTVRLEVRLRQVRVQRTDDPQQQATREDFYSATRRQASQLDYADIDVQWRAQREALLPMGQTPLSYRNAVKHYFLSQHGKED
ncbi:MAG TPA: hypothetical protein VNM24_09870 [Burkholderiales bacterium]|jgi:hypothetical protein|nr:hypothetical protein [Burkholderiales bacterium]